MNPFPTQIWILKETNKNSNNDTYGTRNKVMHMSTWMLLINEVLIRPNLVIGRSHYSIQSWVNPIIYLTGGCHSRFCFFLFFIRDKFAQSIGKCLLFKSDSTRRVVLQQFCFSNVVFVFVFFSLLLSLFFLLNSIHFSFLLRLTSTSHVGKLSFLGRLC